MVTRINLKRICLGLKVLRGAMLLLIPVVLITWWPEPPEVPSPALPSAEASLVEKPCTQRQPLDWYAPLWQRDLKQPPIPTASTKEGREPRHASGPMPTLMGTFVAASQRYAHLRDQAGRMHLTKVDERIDNYRVRAIEAGRVQLQNGGERVWLEMPTPEEP